jgi:hypothetical protein
MSEQQYEIVFYGSLVEGISKDEAQKHIAQLFKTSVDQVARMFTGNRVVIRNKLDRDTAQKYIIAMRKRGAECQVEAMGAPGVKVDLNQVREGTPLPEVAAASTSPTSISTPPTSTPPTPETPPQTLVQNQRPQEIASKSGLQLAGEKVDEILSHSHFDLAEAGERLSEEHEDIILDLPHLDDISLAPAGSTIADKKEDIPVSIPDTSHLSLK